MARPPLDGLGVFLAVAQHGSFRKAAAALEVTPSAISQRIRQLETHLGVPLLARTTRRVGLTEAGRMLLERCKPAYAELAEALEAAGELSGTPRGTLRLTVPRIALPLVLTPVLPVLKARFPGVWVEIHVDDALVDLVRGGYDAGIRVGSMVAQDMVSVALTPPLRSVIVASPAYLALRGRPRSIADLHAHDCVGFRNPSRGDLYRWELSLDGTDVAVALDPVFVVNDSMYLAQAAAAGLGLAYTYDAITAGAEARGELERVLPELGIVEPGLHLYFPTHAQVMPKLRAFLDTAQDVLRPSASRRFGRQSARADATSRGRAVGAGHRHRRG